MTQKSQKQSENAQTEKKQYLKPYVPKSLGITTSDQQSSDIFIEKPPQQSKNAQTAIKQLKCDALKEFLNTSRLQLIVITQKIHPSKVITINDVLEIQTKYDALIELLSTCEPKLTQEALQFKQSFFDISKSTKINISDIDIISDKALSNMHYDDKNLIAQICYAYVIYDSKITSPDEHLYNKAKLSAFAMFKAMNQSNSQRSYCDDDDNQKITCVKFTDSNIDNAETLLDQNQKQLIGNN